MQFLRRSLTTRLIAYFLSLSMLIVAVIVGTSYGNVRSTIFNSIFDRLEAVSTLKEDELNRWLSDKQDEIETLAVQDELVLSMSTLNDYPPESIFYEGGAEALYTFLSGDAALPSFKEVFILSPTGGQVLVSTIPENVGGSRINEPYYTQGRIRSNIQKVYLSPQTGDPTMTIATPVFNGQGELLGVIAGHLDLERLDSVVLQRTGLGDTGESYLVDKFNNFMTPARFGEVRLPRNVSTTGIDFAVQNQDDGQSLYENYEGIPVIGVYDWLDKWDMALITEISQEEALAPARQLQFAAFLTIAFIAIVLVAGTYFIARQVTRPIIAIRDTASRIAEGNLQLEADVHTQDEIGSLATSFNRMTSQLRELLGELEKRVAERTADLETSRLLSERRANQLLSIGEISRTINSEQRLDVLLPLITRLVSERFGNYHTGIFLVDESRQFAVLQAANSEGGRNMLKRGHRLEVGASGIVGYVTERGIPRIALDVGQDAVYFDNPDLPNTRSEMALPLKFRETIIGALDVQSEKPGDFTEDDANTLSILADQIAIAIENARLYEQTQQSIRELQALYGAKLQEGWRSFSHDEGLVGYNQTIGGGQQLTEPISTDDIQQAMFRGDLMVSNAEGENTEASIIVPIKLRGQAIGVMRVKAANRDRHWTTNEINLTEAVSERLSLALENARLIQESQRQAIKEQTIGEITGKIGSSINLQNVLLTAAEELGKSIPGSEVVIKFQSENLEGGGE